MKVIKFGGSSLASADQLKKVLNIVKSDNERRFVVVSAPGKRNSEDTKVTDALIKYYKDYTSGDDVTAAQEWIINRYQAIADELGLSSSIMSKIAGTITNLATLPIECNEFLYDTFLAAGEDNNAKLVAEFSVKTDSMHAMFTLKKQVSLFQVNQEMHAFFHQAMISLKNCVTQKKSLLSQASLELQLMAKSVLSHVVVQIFQVLSLLQVSKQTCMKTLPMLMVSLQLILEWFTNLTQSKN